MQQTNLSDPNIQNSQPISTAGAKTTSFETIKDALWNAFKITIQNVINIFKNSINWLYSFILIFFYILKHASHFIKSKIAVIVDINTQMRNDHTESLHCLNPIDTSACIILTLSYMQENSSNIDFYAATDKLNSFNLNEKQTSPDLTTIETIFQGVKNMFFK